MNPLDDKMLPALAEYLREIREHGPGAGAKVILRHQRQFPDFASWAMAAQILTRADELLRKHGLSR